MLVASEIEQIALSLGIDACGVAPVQVLTEDADYLHEWTTGGYHGSMEYLARNIALREDIRQMVPEAKAIVVCLFNYYKSARQTTDAPRIAQCGLSQEDYHRVVKEKMEELEVKLNVQVKSSRFSVQHIFCDSAPVFERRWAERAGLGWIGKNHLFIHPTLGSFVHIGILVLTEGVDIRIVDGSKLGCGDCTLCLQACPTGAIRGEHFDARKCISYLTIERTEPLEEKYKNIVGQSLYGCDRCQDVCPYNANLMETTYKGLQSNPQLLTMTAADWEKTSRRQKLKLLRRLAK